jgi:5-methylthioadenosine/S-adenosylhomocysteine deaminase
VLVHGIAFTDEDIEIIKKKGASVVWCADSNMFMYNRTARVKKMIEIGVNLCIGTDSPMSGGLNLLYEMKFDRAYYKRTYGERLPEELIVKMVTVNGAKAFRLKKNGYLKNGYIADFVVFSQRHDDPYNSIVASELRDVMLVVIDGKPVYGSSEMSDLFSALDVEYQEVVIDRSEKIVTGDLIGLMKRISRAVGFKKELPFLPVDFDF